MSSYGESIFCSDTAELPIEQACKALYMFQYLDEFNDLAEILREKLKEYFKDIPEKNNEKAYGHYHYEKNGICYYRSTSGSKDAEVIIEPWGDYNDEEEEKVSLTYRYIGFDNKSILHQVKNYLKRRIVPFRKGDYNSPEFSIAEAVEKYETYVNLSEEDKKLIDYDNLIDSLDSNIENNIKSIFNITKPYKSWYYREDLDVSYRTSIFFFKDDSIKKLIEYYDLIMKNGDRSSDNVNWQDPEKIEKFIKILVKDPSVKEIPLKEIFQDVNKEDVDSTFAYFYDHGYQRMKEFAEEDENIYKLLIKLKILPKVKKLNKEKGSKNGRKEAGTECIKQGKVICGESISQCEYREEGTEAGGEIIEATYETV